MKAQNYKFANDLKNLYLKTGDRDIEDLFIQTAQFNEADFISWLENSSDIRDRLGNPTIYAALIALLDIRRSVADMNPGNLVTFLHTKNYLGHVPVFLAFVQLLGSEVNHIIAPFTNILTALEPFSGNQPENVDAVKSDLGIIANEYEQSIADDSFDGVPASVIKQKKMTRKQRRQLLFKYLLISFSNESADGFENMGLSDQSSEVRNGLLMRPNDVAKSVGAETILPVFKKLAQAIYNKHLKPAASLDQDFDLIYDNLKNEIVIASGLVSARDIQQAREKQMGPNWEELIQDENMSVSSVAKPLNIEYDPHVWINSTVSIVSSLILDLLFKASN